MPDYSNKSNTPEEKIKILKELKKKIIIKDMHSGLMNLDWKYSIKLDYEMDEHILNLPKIGNH